LHYSLYSSYYFIKPLIPRALQLFIRKKLFWNKYRFVENDYDTSPELRHELISRGFEIGVHGSTHDASLYRSEKSFRQQAVQINRILKDWNAVGFRSPSMYRNLEWQTHLDMEEKSIDLWIKKLDWLADHVGMALLNIHPDYMIFPTHMDWRNTRQSITRTFWKSFKINITASSGIACRKKWQGSGETAISIKKNHTLHFI
jgi:hypothetical protein